MQQITPQSKSIYLGTQSLRGFFLLDFFAEGAASTSSVGSGRDRPFFLEGAPLDFFLERLPLAVFPADVFLDFPFVPLPLGFLFPDSLFRSLATSLLQSRQYCRGPTRIRILISTCNIGEQNHMTIFGCVSLKWWPVASF